MCGRPAGSLSALPGEKAQAAAVRGHAPQVRDVLSRSEPVMASDLTLVESDRVLARAVALGELDAATAADRRARLNEAATHWPVLRLSPEIIDRARQPFLAEPIRTLDALHFAAALAARSTISGLDLLSLDRRIRRSGAWLGFWVPPA